ncbi:MAG: hypothetical protein Q9218_002856, partial [Villophora microphyllina]
MAKAHQPPPEKSALSKLVPLLILTFVILVFAAIGFVVYSIATEVSKTTSKKMEKKNLVVTKDGMR